MRRPISLGFLLSLALVALVGLAAPDRGLSQEAATPVPADRATPVAVTSPLAEGVDVAALGIAEVAPAGEKPEQVVLTRVTLQPGAEVEDHPHGGTSVLFVESGTICYQNTDERPGATVTAFAEASATAATDGCAPPAPDCATDTGCTLEGDDAVVLTAGDSVTQTQSRSHAYRNVGADVAVVLIAELQTLEIEGCAGGCH